MFLRTDAKGTKPAGVGSGVFTLPIETYNAIVSGSTAG